MKANIYPGRGTWPDWNCPDILALDRLPARASLICFPDFNSCRQAVADNRRYLSPNVVMLREGWECRYYPDILQMPESILSFRSGFDPMMVPTSPPLLPDRAKPAAAYPFPVSPPLVPSCQPVLVCRRTVRLPLTWAGVRKRLVFQGISAAGHVFVNGRLSGYTQGSALPAEFDITGSLHDGDNEIFVLIYPRCDGSYLEKPGTGLPHGLIRDVWLEAMPAISIDDLQIRTIPDPDKEAWQMKVDISLISCRISTESPCVRLSLWKDDECIEKSDWQINLKPVEDVEYASPVQTAGHLTVSAFLTGIRVWSDEKPEVYDLFVSVEDRRGRELMCVHQFVGFRQVVLNEDLLQINGRPVLIRAAEWPATDTPSTIREMVAALRQLKNNHLNSIYIRDFPADPILLELCDIYGVLVIDEAPLDISHPLLLAEFKKDERWFGAALDRIDRLIRRDINHPSVVMWSAGLFRHSGMAFGPLIERMRKLDDSRPIHIIETPDIGLSADIILTDAWSGTQTAGGQLPPAPFGGCCFRWGQSNMHLLREIRQMLRPVQIEAINAIAGVFAIRNRHSSITAGEYYFDWRLLRNGQLVLSGELKNTRANQDEDIFVELPFEELSFDDGAEYLIRFEAVHAKTTLWTICGEEAFFQEFFLAQAERPDLEAPSRSSGRLRLESDRHHLIVSGSRFWLIFNRVNGTLESWRLGDKELIAARPAADGSGPAGLQPAVWRSLDPLDTCRENEWRQAGFDRLIPQVVSCQEGCDGQCAVIEMVIRLAAPGKPEALEMIVRYDVRSIGDLRVFASLRPLLDNLPPLPCFSFLLNLSKAFTHLTWLGGGPLPVLYNLHNNARRGIYNDLQDNQAAEGNLQTSRSGLFPAVEWLSAKGEAGLGLMIRADRLFGFSALPAVRMEMIVGHSGINPKRPLTVQLFHDDRTLAADKPLKAVWHLYPTVS